MFIDLVKNYNAIIPPTLAKKKRESERKVPLRKRTAPVDMRMVRGKISAGAPTRELYAAQHAAQKAAVAIPPVPSLPQAPPANVPAPSIPSTTAEPQPAVAPIQPQPKPQQPLPKPEALAASSPPPVAPAVPAPPAINANESQRPSFKEPPPEDDDTPPVALVVPGSLDVNPNEPQRPSFKEPPPEDDDTPPRPSFAEPPAEEEYSPLPMPKFVDPPVSPPATPPPPPETDIVPPTPQSRPPTSVPVKRDSLINRSSSPSASAARLGSRSPSPADEPKTSLSRSGSGQYGYVRGPRTSRGPRPPGGSNVSSMVSSMNRNSMGGSPPAAPSYKRLSASSQDSRARGVGRTQALSRRTMASDAEDEVVQ